MAKDHGSILNYVLMGGAAYLAWQWYQAQSAPGTVPAVAGGTQSTGSGTQPTGATQSTGTGSGTQSPTSGGAAAPITPAPITGTVGGVAYTGTKASYTAAVIKALGAIASNSQSQTIDEWNWFMDHIGFTGFSSGLGDPDQIMAITGTGRGDAISPATYVDAIQKLGLLPYPTGLTGLAALAAGINRINRHPLAQSAPGNLYYPKPRKVVI